MANTEIAGNSGLEGATSFMAWRVSPNRGFASEQTRALESEHRNLVY